MVTNDDWQTGDISQIPPAFTANIDPKDSIIVASLLVGNNGSANYTAILKGINNGTGIVLVEVYDLEDAAQSITKLENIATRGLVQTGDNAIIASLILGSSKPTTVLLRVTGPTLKDFNINNALTDPTLELRDASGTVLAFNDNWRDKQEAKITATGLMPANNLEPAVKATLAPGNYTAVARGKNDMIGVAVVEAYRVP